MRIAVCAPSTPITRDDAVRLQTLVGERNAWHGASLQVDIHPQSYAVDGHFAGSDAVRLAAFLECANDAAYDAVWFARGGYGACRIAEEAIPQLNQVAQNKAYCGYSDGGYLLAALYRAKIGIPVHAPMPIDLRRDCGERAVGRVLDWFSGDISGLEASLKVEAGEDRSPVIALNLMTLAMLVGTPLMPRLAHHIVMIEEVSEHLYAIDRLLFHASAHLQGIAGLRLGRVSNVPENDRPFGANLEEMVQYWCDRHSIPYLGEADIGHDCSNKIVPFGVVTSLRDA